MARMDLHEAMRLILLDCEGHLSHLRLIVQENRKRELYRCADGTFPGMRQLSARVSKYPTWFERIGPGLIKLAELKQ